VFDALIGSFFLTSFGSFTLLRRGLFFLIANIRGAPKSLEPPKREDGEPAVGILLEGLLMKEVRIPRLKLFSSFKDLDALFCHFKPSEGGEDTLHVASSVKVADFIIPSEEEEMLPFFP
jgi:hypothetical protein